MADISDFRTKMNTSVKDSAGRFNQTEKDAFILEAVRQYSRDRPRKATADLTGDGTAQNFAVPAAWVPRFSTMLQIEYPVDLVPQEKMDLQDNVEIVEAADGVESINLIQLTLGSGELARIQFTAPHTVDATTSTVPDNDFDAVCNLACGHFCMALAALYAEANDAGIAADVVDHEEKARIFGERGNQFYRDYKTHLEVGDSSVGEIRHHDLDVSLRRGQDLIWHRRRLR